MDLGSGGYIYKTTAKTKFGLSDEDLSYLVAKKTRNPHREYGNKPAYLYKEDEIKILARAVHGNLEIYNENRQVKAEGRLAKKQEREAQRQREEDARKAALSEALRVFGLNISSHELEGSIRSVEEYKEDPYAYGYNLVINIASFVKDGHGDVNQLAILLNELHFFEDHTSFEDIYHDSIFLQRGGYVCHLRQHFSDLARDLALNNWARAFPSREAALADPNLPESLKDTVRQIEMNE